MRKTINWKFIAIIISLFFLCNCGNNINSIKQPPSVPAYDIEEIINKLPDGQTWLDHLTNDLIPFWTMEEALGDPIGNFPTYRSNEGKLVDKNDFPPEYKAALQDKELKGLIRLDRSYVRAQARQTFAYGIAYHLIGEEIYLRYAKAGVDYLRKHSIDRKMGGAYSYYDKEKGEWGPAIKERTSQDMAYALSGIGFYYYLTQDKDVLQDILDIKDHIFTTYYDHQLDLLRWVIEESPDKDTPDQKELVSQLDQVYGYMLWLAPSMPPDIQEHWKKDLEHLASIMIEQFFSVEYHFFWGQITDINSRYLEAPHTDFGHSIKTLWLIYRIGKYCNNLSLLNFARENAKRIIDYAYIEETGSWARRFNREGKLDHEKEWWALAELDQTTSTLGLNDPSLLRYLPQTYDYWLKHMVDHENHGVWHMVSSADNKPVLKYPKVHSWKNSFHTFEHALICYMTTQKVKRKPIALYYAFKNRENFERYIHPYFFFGKFNKEEVEVESFSELPGYFKFKVKFTDLR